MGVKRDPVTGDAQGGPSMVEDAPASRTIIPHVDDLGASHGANAAFLDLVRRGAVLCGSVMVPGPWFREIADAGTRDTALDLGVHLTLTSEWDACRWAPISTTSRSSGLIDEDGYFWRDVESLKRHLVPEAAEAEMRAQVERALAAGLAPTHVDAHMGAAMLPDLLPAHITIAVDYGLMPILPRSITWAPDPACYRAAVAALDERGWPVIDHCRGTLPVDAAALADGWRALLSGLPGGLTHLALHCTTPSDFAAMAPVHDGWRTREHALFASGFIQSLCISHDIATTSTRALQARWRAQIAKGHGSEALDLRATVDGA
jgi:chitin disaccharide deacetylase